MWRRLRRAAMGGRECVRLGPDGPVAQRLEQWTHNPLVPGSNPGGPTRATDEAQWLASACALTQA